LYPLGDRCATRDVEGFHDSIIFIHVLVIAVALENQQSGNSKHFTWLITSNGSKINLYGLYYSLLIREYYYYDLYFTGILFLCLYLFVSVFFSLSLSLSVALSLCLSLICSCSINASSNNNDQQNIRNDVLNKNKKLFMISNFIAYALFSLPQIKWTNMSLFV
jgi:hypothetical protein